MPYSRTGKWPNIGIECSIHYDYNGGQGSVPAVLEFEPLGAYAESDFQFRFPQSILEISSQGQGREFTIPKDFTGGEILIENQDPDNNRPPAQIDIVPTKTIHLLHRLIEDGENLQEYQQEMKSIYASSDGPAYMRFTADAEKVLEFRPYMRILSMTSNYSSRGEKIISDNRHSYFENRLLNPREPNYVSSFEDLLNKITFYNSREHLEEVNLNIVLRNGLTKLFTRIENSGFDYVSEIIDRVIPRRREDFAQLDKLPMSIYVSIFLYSEKPKRAKRLFSSWCNDESNRRPEFADQGQFSNISSESIIGFIYQVALRKIKNGEYRGTFPIFETVRISTSTNESPRLHDLAEYHSLMRRGYRNLSTDPSKARQNFDEVLRNIESSDILKNNQENSRYIRALDSKCKAVVADYQNSSDLGSAITYISRFVEQELAEIQNSSYLHERVQGLRSELIARKHVQDRSLDLAINQIEEGIQHYRDSGKRSDEEQSLRLFIQQKVLTAYQSEKVGEFKEASEIYEELSSLAHEGLDSQNREKAFKIRSHVCAAKHEVLNSDLSEAKDHITSISELGPARRENEAIVSVINLLEDYENRRVSNTDVKPKVVSEKLSDMMFEIETDYRPISSVLSAVQHIRRYGFEKDLLDPMVMITLQNSFIPRDIEGEHSDEQKSLDNSEYSYLIELSTSDRWQAKLPSHIHYLLEQLKVDEVSTSGNHSPLADQITKILELFLEVFSDYYSEMIHGVSSPDSTLNPLIDFIHSMPDGSVANISETQSILRDSVLGSEHIGNVRNTTHHGEKIYIGEEEYEKIRDIVMEVLHNLSSSAPIIIEVIDKNKLGPYLVALHWGAPGSRSWVNTNAELEVGELYYLPPGAIERSHIIDIPEQEIVACTKERARQAKMAGEELFK